MDQILRQLRQERDNFDAAIRAIEALKRSEPTGSKNVKLKAETSGLNIVRPAAATTAA